MVVLTVPCRGHPRHDVPAPVTAPYAFYEEQFPLLTSLESKAALISKNLSTGARTWVEVVRYGALKTPVAAVIDDNKCSPQISIPNPEPEPEFHNFMQLARELRLVIWDLAMRDEPYHQPNGIGMRYFIDPIALREYVKVGDDPISPNFLPAICSVSEATKEEIIAVVIEGSKFMVASIKDNAFLQTFLKAAPGRLELCRDLSFDFFSRFPYGYEKNSDLELAVLCNGLRTIKLTFHFEPLTYLVMESEDNMTLSRRARSPNELLENFKLQRLLDCRSLKNITIEQTSQHVMEASRAANDLGELIKTKFSQLSPPQHVGVLYTRQAPRPRRLYTYY
ncbi:hypothetical protein HBH96_065870 [Parastagonospora nodorum]|nr:hypothetical protein HBH96_065870 [Parastagonospora nodorum]